MLATSLQMCSVELEPRGAAFECPIFSTTIAALEVFSAHRRVQPNEDRDDSMCFNLTGLGIWFAELSYDV
jgi:hypothetical protein